VSDMNIIFDITIVMRILCRLQNLNWFDHSWVNLSHDLVALVACV